MNSVVVFESRYRNTEKIAYAIAAGLRHSGSVRIFSIADAPATFPDDITLLVIGGPTEGHGMTAAMARYLDRLGHVPAQLVAAYDTRLRAPRWLSGSAASGIVRRLRGLGADEVAEPLSFFVGGKSPVLENGELDRAQAWAFSLVDRVSKGALMEAATAGSPTG
jgi:flavodoxin